MPYSPWSFARKVSRGGRALSSLSHDTSAYPPWILHRVCSAHVGTTWLTMSTYGQPHGQHPRCWLGWWRVQYLPRAPSHTTSKTSAIAILSSTSRGTPPPMAVIKVAMSGRIERPSRAAQVSPVQPSPRATGKECLVAIATRPFSTGCWGGYRRRALQT